jgi:nitrogen fixation protein NifU and related proteins
MYTDKVMEHFKSPRNMGEIPDADGIGTVGNPTCGDLMTMYIKVKDDRIEDLKFKTYGCGAAIATSSMTTELAKGKTLEEAMEITRASVADSLGGLPKVKMHCSNLAADALHAAIEDYREKTQRGARMKKVEAKCKSCAAENEEPCDHANYTTEIDGKTYTFCCQAPAVQHKAEKTKEKK